MSSVSTKDHFQRIAAATEEDLEEELSSLTVIDACRISEALLACAPHLLGPEVEELTAEPEFVSLRELIQRHHQRTRVPSPR